MIVRALDADGDWTFGKGRNNYLRGKAALIQLVNTRLHQFLGDCFFATDEGIDWFNLLGSKDEVRLELAIRATILNTDGISGISRFQIILDSEARHITIMYELETVEGVISTFASPLDFLLTEDGLILTTEDGRRIVL